MPMSDEVIRRAAIRGSGAHPASEPPRYLAVARIRRPWGVRGQVKIEVWTDFPERFAQAGQFYLGPGYLPIWLEAGRHIQGDWVLKFAGYDTPEMSGALRNQILYIRAEDAMPLEEGDYYAHQIIGLEVWTDEGEFLGRVVDVMETGANDVYILDRAGQDLLLPAIEEVVHEIDLEAGRMTVHKMEGLLP